MSKKASCPRCEGQNIGHYHEFEVSEKFTFLFLNMVCYRCEDEGKDPYFDLAYKLKE